MRLTRVSPLPVATICRLALPTKLSSVVRWELTWVPWMIHVEVFVSKLGLRMYCVPPRVTVTSSMSTSPAASMRI